MWHCICDVTYDHENKTKEHDNFLILTASEYWSIGRENKILKGFYILGFCSAPSLHYSITPKSS
jgi:hypothetical protein